MGNKGDNKLRPLLKSFEVETPPQEFAEEVMNEIETIAGDKVHADSSLKVILEKNIYAEPPTGFTYKVLNQVREQQRVSYPPIISKKVWISIACFVVICLIVAIVDGRTVSHSADPYFYISIADHLSNFTIRYIEPMFYLGLIVVPAIVLLLIDYFFRKKLQSRM